MICNFLAQLLGYQFIRRDRYAGLFHRLLHLCIFHADNSLPTDLLAPSARNRFRPTSNMWSLLLLLFIHCKQKKSTVTCQLFTYEYDNVLARLTSSSTLIASDQHVFGLVFFYFFSMSLQIEVSFSFPHTLLRLEKKTMKMKCNNRKFAQFIEFVWKPEQSTLLSDHI